MRTKITIDDDLVEAAEEYTGISSKPALVREALRYFVKNEIANRDEHLRNAAEYRKRYLKRNPPKDE